MIIDTTVNLRTVAKSIITLIIDSNQMRIHKGLLLLQFHLNRCAPESLDPFSAEDPELTSIITPLVTVIVYQAWVFALNFLKKNSCL